MMVDLLWVRTITEPSFFGSFPLWMVVLILGGGFLVACTLVWVSFKLPTAVLLGGALGVGVIQLYGPFGFTSIGLLTTAALIPVAIVRARREPPGLWLWLLGALTLWQVIATLWSEKIGSAAYPVVESVALAAVVLLTRTLLRERGIGGLARALMIAAPFVLIQASLVTVFLMLPRVERAYLHSPIARVFTEPGVEALAQGSTENVSDIGKAGGFFLNANTASLFFAIVACLYLWLALQRPGRRTFWVALFVGVSAADACIGTGSKTPLVAIVVLPAAALLVLLFVRRPVLAVLIAAALAAAGVAAISLVVNTRAAALSEVFRTLGERRRLWQIVFDNVPDHWFFGLGFGNWRWAIAEGWHDTFFGRGFQPFPPHNLYAQAWADAGVVSLLLTLALSLLPIGMMLRRIRRDRADRLFSRRSMAHLLLLVGTLWMIAHGMLDTTTFLGDNHVLPFYGVLVAVVLHVRAERLSRTPEATR